MIMHGNVYSKTHRIHPPRPVAANNAFRLSSGHSPNDVPPPHLPYLGPHDALHIHDASVGQSFTLSTVSRSDNRVRTPMALGLRIQVHAQQNINATTRKSRYMSRVKYDTGSRPSRDVEVSTQHHCQYAAQPNPISDSTSAVHPCATPCVPQC